MGLGIGDTPGVLSWDQGQDKHTPGGLSWEPGIRDTPGVLSWDQGLETLQECCHGIRDKTYPRRVAMGSRPIHNIGLLSWDQG
jgi:hypothetical protein